MIEIIYNKEKEKAAGKEEYFCVPRNIRQMGDVPKENKIYMEDYVYTFLTSDWKEEEPKGRIAILLGRCNWKNEMSYVFIKSAVIIEEAEATREGYSLTDSVWGTVYEQMKTYFPGEEVVGWCLSMPDSGLRVTDSIVQMHVKHFGGNDKVLLLTDPYEHESIFYLYKNQKMEKLTGYYIFYEKNERMQEYMLAKKKEMHIEQSGKNSDKAVQDFRKIIARKKVERDEKKSWSPWAAAACVGVAAISVGISAFWLSGQGSSNNEVDYLNAEESAAVLDELLSMGESFSEEEEMVLLTPEASVSPETSVTPENIEPVPDVTVSPDIDRESADEAEGVSEKIPEEFSEEASEETSISVYTKYTVRKGDTISKISLRYYGDFSKISEICKINNMLEEDVIYPGQTILLP